MKLNREAWLTAAIPHLSKIIAKESDLVVPDATRASVGWPGSRSINKVVGQCWKSECDLNGHSQIFVSPRINDPHEVLAVLLHELIHAADNCESGHQKAFRKCWKAVGFVGKPTTSEPGEELADRLAAIADRLGDYPNSGMTPKRGSHKPQVSRQLKVECSHCGCICRMSRKAIDECGLPTCACGTPMEEA